MVRPEIPTSSNMIEFVLVGCIKRRLSGESEHCTIPSSKNMIGLAIRIVRNRYVRESFV